MTQTQTTVEEILTNVEEGIKILIRASLQEFLKQHRSKLDDHCVVFYPLSILGLGNENPTVFTETIALVPRQEPYPEEADDAIKDNYNIRIEFKVFNNKPLNGK